MTSPTQLLHHAATLTHQGDVSLTLDPLQHAWRNLHGDTPLAENTYKLASEAVSATAGVEHHEKLWFTVFSRRNLDQVAALLRAAAGNVAQPELEAPEEGTHE